MARGSVPAAFATGTGATGSARVVVHVGAGGAAGPCGDLGGVGSRFPGALVVIDVVGQVARPGVVTVPDGSRVVDVLTAAGGALPGADVQRLNLARLVADGEQVFVPRPGETPPVPVGALGRCRFGSRRRRCWWGGRGPAARPCRGGHRPQHGDASRHWTRCPASAPFSRNASSTGAQQHGRFASVDELGEVSGIGDKLLEQIRPKVRV